MSQFERSLKIMFSSVHQVMKSDQKLLVEEHIMNKTVWGRTLRRRGCGCGFSGYSVLSRKTPY